jgi:hypothetical protein
MVLEKSQDRYRGVLCNFCRQPIPLPGIVNRWGEQAQAAAPSSERALELLERSFHIRCRCCEKESSYRSSDVVEVEGAPRLRNFRGRAGDRAGFLRGHGDLAKAANA